MKKVDLSTYQNSLSRKNQIIRFLWNFVWGVFARPLPRSVGNGWKLFLLKIFGAKIHSTAVVYSSANIYIPMNLEMDEYSCLASEVDCYNVGRIKIGKHSTVSQRAFLCTASHDISKTNHPLVVSSIIIQDQVWIGAEAFVGPGVSIGEGSVLGARAAVFKDVPSWSVYGGNPAVFLKSRILEDEL